MTDAMGGQIVFRRALAGDAPLLARTQRDAWAAAYRGIYPDAWIDSFDFETRTARWRETVQDAAQEVWLILDAESCAGYYVFGAPRHGAYKQFSLCLNALYLLPPYQRRGIGRVIFVRLYRQCAAGGIEGFFCGCNLHNLPAQRFYKKMGGIPGSIDSGHTNRAEDQIYYEFYLGDRT